MGVRTAPLWWTEERAGRLCFYGQAVRGLGVARGSQRTGADRGGPRGPRRRRRRGPQAGGGHRAFGRCLLAIEKAGGQSRAKTPGRDNRHSNRRPAEAQAAEHGAHAQVPAPHPGRLLQGLAPGAGAGPPRARSPLASGGQLSLPGTNRLSG